MTKKLSAQEKRNRKPAAKACVFCHSKHLQCSNERPCKNCVKRNLGDQCRDVERKRAKYMNSNLKRDPKAIEDIKLATDNFATEGDRQTISTTPQSGTPAKKEKTNHSSKYNMAYLEAGERPPTNPMSNTTNDVLNRLLYNDPINVSDHDSDNLSMNNSISGNGITAGVFNSNYLNQEYLMLGDIILHSKPTSPSPSNTSASEYNLETVSPSSTLLNTNLKLHKLNPTVGNGSGSMKDSRPFISLGFSEDFNNYNFKNNSQIINQINTTNNNEYISPLISHHLYQSVQDIYSNNIMDFDYPQSYHSLTKFLKSRFSGNSLPEEEKQKKRNNLLIILKLIASYRPTFISSHKSLLKPYDLQFLEMAFQRSLLDYEKLSQLNPSPTIMWRRTGEIVALSDDLLSLLGFNLGDILSKRTFIMELMYDDESIINYFKLFKSVAVGNLHSTIITKCKLIRNIDRENPNPVALPTSHPVSIERDYIEFCSVWTVKRDLFDLPTLIIGQFLPILPAGEGVRSY